MAPPQRLLSCPSSSKICKGAEVAVLPSYLVIPADCFMNLTRIYAVVLRHLYTWSRSLERLSEVFWFPLMDLFVWGFFTLYLSSGSMGLVNPVLLILSGLILWTVVYRSQYEISLSLAEEIWSQNLLNLFASPLSIWEFISATVLLSMVKLTVVLTLMSLMAFVLYSYNALSLGLFAIPFVAILAVFGFLMGVFINGLILRFGKDAQALAWTAVFAVQPFSCIFYPLSILPSWAQKISLLLPSTYVFEGMRSLIITGHLPIFYLLMGIILDLFYLVLTLIFFKNMFEKAKELGLLSRLLD